MVKGIYKYTDLKTGEIVYVGKDSHIDKHRRHKEHMRPSLYDEQQINRVLQNNPDRYEYGVIWASEDCTELKLNKMEILFGKIYDPKFNFDKFGKGGCKGHTEETKRKISEANKGQKPWNTNKSLDSEHKHNISKASNTTGYLNVYKAKNKGCKQGFTWCYRYTENSKRKNIASVDIKKLKEKVKAKGLKWQKLKED